MDSAQPGLSLYLLRLQEAGFVIEVILAVSRSEINEAIGLRETILAERGPGAGRLVAPADEGVSRCLGHRSRRLAGWTYGGMFGRA